MKQDAVQSPRDRDKHPGRKNNNTLTELTVQSLLNAEVKCGLVRVPQQELPTQEEVETMNLASLHDVCDCIEQQMLTFVKWTNVTGLFKDLPASDQTRLLHAHSYEQFLLRLAYCSLHLQDVLLLDGNYVIPRDHPHVNLARLAGRILDELVEPLRELEINDLEIAH